MALTELERHEKLYVLSPDELDLIVNQLDSDDIDFLDHALRIINRYVDKKKLAPSNISESKKMLRALLAKYPKPLQKQAYKNFRTHIIYILGHYNDYAVIERLMLDAEELDNLDEMQDYESNLTAHIIEDNRAVLYEFEEKLKLEGKKRTFSVHCSG